MGLDLFANPWLNLLVMIIGLAAIVALLVLAARWFERHNEKVIKKTHRKWKENFEAFVKKEERELKEGQEQFAIWKQHPDYAKWQRVYGEIALKNKQETERKLREEEEKRLATEQAARDKAEHERKLAILAPFMELEKARAEDERQTELRRIRQEHRRWLLKKSEDGEDVCFECETYHPKRCKHCNACIDGCRDSHGGTYCTQCESINWCGDPTCNGWCNICDDDDSDDYYYDSRDSSGH